MGLNGKSDYVAVVEELQASHDKTKRRLEAVEKVLQSYVKASEEAQVRGSLFALVDADFQYADLAAQGEEP